MRIPSRDSDGHKVQYTKIMYLTSIEIQNLGPIPSISFSPAIDDGFPRPIVVVGTNGSGKSTLLSTIVSSLVAFKQQAFQNTEVDSNRVFRLRGSRFLRSGESHYFWQLEFESGLKAAEWCLNQTRESFENSSLPKPRLDGWKEMAPDQDSGLFLTPNPGISLGPNPVLSAEMQERFRENVVLYFPADRFEPPDWLNSGSPREDLAFHDPVRLNGNTCRNIFSRSMLKPTLEWLRGVFLDRHLSEPRPIITSITLNTALGTPPLTPPSGPDSKLINAVSEIIRAILNAKGQSVGFDLGHRTAPRIGIKLSGKSSIPDLLSLSAGQSTLFCIFCAILRDADLASGGNFRIESIKGIVVIDEADLHLHLDLQNRALPQLMKMFPKVQFILTAHSPMLVIGVEKAYGREGFHLLEMPHGTPISCERYSEFDAAFQHFSETARFKSELLDLIKAAKKPVLIVEGKSDRLILETAWSKLEPSRDMPFEVHSCGESRPSDSGGAKTLCALIEAISLYETRPIVGLFDNDHEGATQFNSLNAKKSFNDVSTYHRQHQRGHVSVIILPPPKGRELFVPEAILHRQLEIEHYFSDSVLDRFCAVGNRIYGSPVFAIPNAAKRRISEGVSKLTASDFENFRALFSTIESALQVTHPGKL